MGFVHGTGQNRIAAFAGSGFGLIRVAAIGLTRVIAPLSAEQAGLGDARDGGKRRAAWEASLRSRWARIFLMTSGSSMQTMTCMDALMSREAGCRERLT